MRKRLEQLPFRKHLGEIETAAEAKKRMGKIKQLKKDIEKSKSIVIDKNHMKFKMYKNDTLKKKALKKELSDQLISVNRDIRKINVKITSEFIAPEHKNTKIDFTTGEVKEIKYTREEMSTREKRMRGELKILEEKKEKIEMYLTEL